MLGLIFLECKIDINYILCFVDVVRCSDNKECYMIFNIELIFGIVMVV